MDYIALSAYVVWCINLLKPTCHVMHQQFTAEAQTALFKDPVRTAL
jgi:hypothetical protein